MAARPPSARALSTAINRLRELKSKSKIVILMTDGQNNAGKVAPLTVAEAAKALGVKVYTIGVGKRGESRRPHGRQAVLARLLRPEDLRPGPGGHR